MLRVAKLAERLRSTRLPLVPLLPAIVVVVGVSTAVLIGMLGLAHLRWTSDRVAAGRADVLAVTVAARLRATSSEDHGAIVRRAARRSGTEVLLASHDGTALVDGTFGPSAPERVIDLLVRDHGIAHTRIGRTQFRASPLGQPFGNLAVVVFVPAPLQPEGATALFSAVVGLTALLLGVAGTVAYGVGRELRRDVDFVRAQIVKMAEPSSSPTGTPIRIRFADQVGLLTHAFNVLVDRFAAAERAYQRDLEHVAALDRDRAAFLGALSHELRTPLNAILGFADVLLSEVDGPLNSDTRENLEMVRASGSHLRGLIDDILELSAIESGQLRLSRTLVDIHAVAEDVMREAAARVVGQPVTLTVTGPSPSYAFVDERRVWQILSNLVSNAIKFTSEGAVSVDLGIELGQVKVSVNDTGAGIPASELETIFDEFR
ncbi:MAG: HAMP domain-containing histidine kinase, partial [Polyangiaceae bacterium]|nr:HAMP domain-containing histidine kinase [Polyangiaceae bacterium]